jgi:hypothetical protein
VVLAMPAGMRLGLFARVVLRHADDGKRAVGVEIADLEIGHAPPFFVFASDDLGLTQWERTGCGRGGNFLWQILGGFDGNGTMSCSRSAIRSRMREFSGSTTRRLGSAAQLFSN